MQPSRAEARVPELESGAEFAQHLVRSNPSLMRYVLTLLPRRADADEVLQRVAVILWQRFGEYDRTREFLPWAIRLTYFEVLNYRKEYARGRLVFRDEVVTALADCRPEYDELGELRRIALEKCLKKVDAAGRSLLRRRYCDSESIADLAVEWGQTAKSLYRRLDRLRASIADCVHNRMIGIDHD